MQPTTKRSARNKRSLCPAGCGTFRSSTTIGIQPEGFSPPSFIFPPVSPLDNTSSAGIIKAMPARRRKTSKKTKVKARAHSSKTARLRKTSTASRRRSKSASKTPARPKVKSRKPSAKRQAKRAVPQKRAMSRPKPERQSREMTPNYDMVVEEIEVTSSPENHLQTDLWGLEIPKP
jgi:hypothetical protein